MRAKPTLFESISIALPPRREQARIVAKIEELFSELDKGIESLTAARQQLTAYRQSVLKHAFEGKLTETWRAGYRKQFTATDDALARIRSAREARYAISLTEWHNAMARWRTNGQIDNKPSKPERICEQPAFSPQDLASLPSLPPNWTWVRLGEFFSSSPQNGLYKPASSYGNGTPIIRIDSFYDGVITRDIQFKRLALRPDEIEKYRVNVGDVLINRVNSIEYLGKCALVTKIEEPTVFESNIMKFSILDSEISNRYLVAYLASRGGKNRLCQNAKHAVNQASINQTDVALTPVPFAPIVEQHEIVKQIEAMLSGADRAEKDIEIQLAKSNMLRQSILKKAFSGQLAAQDATDEPASALLARICAEREKSEPKKKRNGKNGKKIAV